MLDMTMEQPTPEIKAEKFCTEWTCVKKLVQFITLDGEKVTIEEYGEKTN